MWIVIGIVVCFLGMMPFAQQLYTFVAEPLMVNLPKDTSMIATDVIAPFFVPVKVTLRAAFLPVVVVLLAKIGIVTTEQLKNARPYVIVGAFVIAAIITPPDVISQTLLAVPLILLYEAGIWCSRFIKPKSDEPDEHPPLPPAET